MFTLKARTIFISLCGVLTLNACKTTDDGLNTLSAVNGQGDPWSFSDCKKRALEGTEVVETPTSFQVFRKFTVEGAKATLVYTDEFGEEYTLEVASSKQDSARQVWSGKAKLSNAVELDSKPFIIGYEVVRDGAQRVLDEIITTKVELPPEYYEDDVKKAFEINKFSAHGDSVSMLLMQNAARPGFDYVVTRVCGKGFARTADAQRKPAADEFRYELSL